MHLPFTSGNTRTNPGLEALRDRARLLVVCMRTRTAALEEAHGSRSSAPALLRCHAEGPSPRAPVAASAQAAIAPRLTHRFFSLSTRNSGMCGRGQWLRPHVTNTETITSARPEPSASLVKQEGGREPLLCKPQRGESTLLTAGDGLGLVSEWEALGFFSPPPFLKAIRPSCEIRQCLDAKLRAVAGPGSRRATVPLGSFTRSVFSAALPGNPAGFHVSESCHVT